ncbi:MAG: sn-glycerol-3-phosphate import ATP-binding protein UgpC, partial [Methyloligellaceae bacterium]
GNQVQAISDMNLDVADGEFVVLVGPSGCGKSTLLRMIAGLETITSGEIRIGDRVVNNLEPADRDIAMVFQNYALYPHMTVFNNMAYGLRNRRTPAAEIETRVRDAARLLEIEPFLDRTPRQLSGGQRQRVAMGRAIVRKPAAFLFDEPLSNLDAKLRVQMRVEIRKLQRELGTTSVYVTHDQVEAMTMADRLVVMNQGVAEQIGTPRDLYQTPATVFVAGFIGSPAMNFLDAEVSGAGDALQIGEVKIPLGADERPGPGQAVNLGIRPEHLEIVPENGHITLETELVEHLGADTIVYGQVSGANGQRLAFRVHGDKDFGIGDNVQVSAQPQNLHLFDRETGRRIVS